MYDKDTCSFKFPPLLEGGNHVFTWSPLELLGGPESEKFRPGTSNPKLGEISKFLDECRPLTDFLPDQLRTSWDFLGFLTISRDKTRLIYPPCRRHPSVPPVDVTWAPPPCWMSATFCCRRPRPPLGRWLCCRSGRGAHCGSVRAVCVECRGFAGRLAQRDTFAL